MTVNFTFREQNTNKGAEKLTNLDIGILVNG
jgi:hypothetical protein